MKKLLRVDSMCGRFSKGYKRQQRCSEWLETDKFKTTFPEIIRDPDNADSPLDNCIKDQPLMRNPQFIDALIGKNIIVKMFLSPLMLANGDGKKQFYAFQGIDADSIFFLYHDNETKIKTLIGYCSSKDNSLSVPIKDNSKQELTTVDSKSEPSIDNPVAGTISDNES